MFKLYFIPIVFGHMQAPLKKLRDFPGHPLGNSGTGRQPEYVVLPNVYWIITQL